MNPSTRAPALLLLLAAASCGGSSSSPTVPGSETLTALYTRSVNAVGGITAGGQMNLGEYWTGTDLESRIFFLFDLTALPPGSVVTQATLTVYVTGSDGAPLGFQPITVDHDGRPGIDPAQSGDFGAAYDDEGAAALGALAVQAMTPDHWVADVTSVVGSAWANGDAASVFRLWSAAAPLVNGSLDRYLVGGIWPGDAQVWEPVLEIDYLAP